MLLFKIVNPSDPYTVEAPSLEVAVMTAVLIGQGNYAFKSLDGGQDVPMFSFGGGDAYCQEHFKEDLMELANRVMDTKLGEVADCLDSILYGDEQDRIKFLETCEGMDRPTFEAARAIRQDRKCSSLNDIGSFAYIMAGKLRKSIAEGIKTLQ